MKRADLALAFPLVAFVVPSAVIGYGFVLPRAGHTGIDELTVGFAATLVGACITYLIGVRLALRRPGRRAAPSTGTAPGPRTG